MFLTQLSSPRNEDIISRGRTAEQREFGEREMNPANQFLYMIRPTRAAMLSEGLTPGEDAIVSEHFEYLKNLTERGIVALAGRTLSADEGAFGIVIFLAETADAAREIMANDPAVRQGVMRAELFPFRIALRGEKA
jgi:uncharacterized protein